MAWLRTRVSAAWRSGIFHRALLVAIVVGTVLNLINQGDAVFTGHAINWLKALLTYLVPFMVSSHGGLTASRWRADPTSAV